MEETKQCVACRMDIRADAAKCPHCRERQAAPGPMHRGGEGRVVAGVCLALARQLGLDVGLVRVAFVLALVVTGGSALGVYLLLWMLTPATAMGRAPVQRVMSWVGKVAGSAVEEPRMERKV
ncbi:PspC domain-containing protein [Archangium violaceum]|uniref:PspC domain-containing protein n=1 Tax=Archangium violaceum TaxID=83451 RepID=UPI00193C0038|nr:PspC domain-containing protein [Archangium violaceum]QRK09584.1 PspC domain-containing protein [Archangium violaceum]